MAPGEGGDHVQADAAVLEEAGDVDLVGVGEQGVHPALLVAGHAQAPVLDLDGDPGGDAAGAQQDLGVGGGEHRGVLDQFGEEVDGVGDGVAAYVAVDRGHQLDPRVLLDLGDGGAQHLGHGDRPAPLAAGHRAAEDGEVLGVAADAGGEVVDVEEALEQVGVLDLVLQFVQELDLAVDEGLQAPGEVDEDLDLLFAAGLAGELGGLDHGVDGHPVGAVEFLAEQVEAVAARGEGRLLGGGLLAPAEGVEDVAQFGLVAGAGAAELRGAVQDVPRGAVGGDGGDGDPGEGHGGGAGEDRPEQRGGGFAAVGGAQREEHRGGAAEGDRDGRQDRDPQQLRPYVRLGELLGGLAVPAAALTAVRPVGGRCA